MGPVLQRLRPYGGAIALTLGLIVVQTLAELGLPTLMARIIDQGVLKGDPSAIWSGGLAMVGVALVGAAASVGAAWVSAQLAAGFGRDLRADVFRKITGLSVDRFAALGASSLITRTTNDVTQVVSLVVMGLRMFVAAPLMALGGVVMALVLDPGLATVLLVAVPALAVAIFVLARRAMTLFRLVQERIDRLNQVLRESLSGVRVIRAFDRQAFDASRFEAANLDLADVSLQTQRLMSVVMPGMLLAMSLTSVALVWFGGLRIEAGVLQVGGLMAFLQYATQILFSLLMLSILFVVLPRALVSARRIAEVLEVPASDEGIEGADSGVFPGTQGAEVRFEDVTFRYPGAEQPALAGVSFTVPAGKVTALIGGTGSGKSTALQLITRFHRATSGRVLVDGRDVLEWSKPALRHRMGWAPQKARLFTGTLGSNLRWGAPEADQAALDRAIALAQATDFVNQESEGFERTVDKAGANLSGGQKQRLSIARALVREPDLLLFDDSFSALDTRTDAALRRALRENLEGTTVLLVAQRVATVREADQIVVLDQGRVAGTGTHEDLLNRCPVYQEIVASQGEADR